MKKYPNLPGVYFDVFLNLINELGDTSKLNGFLFSSITLVKFEKFRIKLKNIIVDKGYDKNYVNISKATALIPFFLHPGIFGTLDNEYVLDGGVSVNCPVFTDKLRK